MEHKTLQSFGSLLKKSSTLFSEKFLSLTGILSLFVIPTIIIIYSVMYINPFRSGEVTTLGLLLVLGVYLLIGILIFIHSLLTSSALLIYVGKANRGQSIRIFEALYQALSQLWAIIRMYAHYSKRISFGFLKFIIPGFYRIIVYAFAPLIFLLDKKNEEESLNESVALIKPHIIKYLDYMLFAFLVALACSVPFMIIFDFAIDWYVNQNQWRWVEFFDFLEVCVILEGMLFVFVFNVVLFENLKELRSSPELSSI